MAATLETPVIAVTRPETPSTPPLPVEDRLQTRDASPTTAPPPRHPLTARFVDPEPVASPNTPLGPPPLRRETTAADAKLAELEDLEIQDLLQRVGDYLTDVKVAGLDAETVGYPEIEAYSKEEGGAVDWIGYGVAVSRGNSIVRSFVDRLLLAVHLLLRPQQLPSRPRWASPARLVLLPLFPRRP